MIPVETREIKILGVRGKFHFSLFYIGKEK